MDNGQPSRMAIQKNQKCEDRDMTPLTKTRSPSGSKNAVAVRN
ncbi:hypothetical protein RISK_006156 [Rhodopirellula islandica]|uniref:Uncharacterized protein n=1 Tax=Rhodopirellula islandica TaxID=595434 RepID=A0A0J1B5H0_RHOIS|nr:hypothetical protein RISK_006156 [Rhodopirellula islandica]